MVALTDLAGGRLFIGDVLDGLSRLPDESVNCCVTSPPYWGLRDYGADGQLGLEATPEEYVANMVAVFRAVRRVLRADGTLWLNLGDSYAAGGSGRRDSGKDIGGRGGNYGDGGPAYMQRPLPAGLKQKELVGIPWRTAFGLQADGWYLRQDIIWAKPNPMPESVTDRCTKSHEYVFLLSRSPRYYYDAASIAEPLAESSVSRLSQPTLEIQAGSNRVPGKTNGAMKAVGPRFGGNKYGDDESELHRTKSVNQWTESTGGANKRSVWRVASKPYKGAHFATFPPRLIEPCILAGCPEGGTVLDPFMGSGTTAQVAVEHRRKWVGCELNPKNEALIRERLKKVQPCLV